MRREQTKQIELGQELCGAARRGDLAAARDLLAQGAHADSRSLWDNTPFLIAAEHGFPHLFPLLIERGANAAAERNDGSNALAIACHAGQRSSLAALLGIKSLAAWENDAFTKGVVRRALSGAALGLTPRHEKTLILLLRALRAEGMLTDSKEANRLAFQNHRGATPLMAAAKEGAPGNIRRLAQYFDVAAKNDRGADALLIAMRSKDQPSAVEALTVLLAAGSDPAASDIDGRTALMEAARSAKSECVEILARVSDVQAADGQGETALMAAVAGGNAQLGADAHRCVRVLLPLSDPSAVNAQGQTALAIALRAQAKKGGNDIQQAHLDTITLLAEATSASMAVDSGATAFEDAMACQSWAAANALAPAVSDAVIERTLVAFAESVGPAVKARAEALFLRGAVNAARAPASAFEPKSQKEGSAAALEMESDKMAMPEENGFSKKRGGAPRL